jgi:two-component system chemotaxis sensor kinase CheA
VYNPIGTFLGEAEDLLVEIEGSALGLINGDSSPETINQLFRAFHTIKGSGSMFGFNKVAEFTHHVETTLDEVRSGTIQVTKELATLLLAAKDHIKLLLSAEQNGEVAETDAGCKLVADIRALGRLNDVADEQTAADNTPVPLALQGEEHIWEIEFKPARDLMSCGGNPELLFRDLGKLGAFEIRAHTDDIPALDEIQPDACYLWWTITLRTASDLDEIRDVFVFVEDGGRIEIKPQIKQMSELPAGRDQSSAAEDVAPKAQQQEAQQSQPHKVQPRESMVRVPADRLDRLVGLVGELVMNQSRLAQAASHFDSPELAVPVEEIERLVAELRDDVLGIRMMQIGTIFGRFRRLVHDLSIELGKEVDLETRGEETELDKSILDQLAEPLVHLLRNSIGHGIEPAEQRLADGKPRRGTISLHALHTGSGVVITVVDDGRGLNRTAIRAKAVEKGLIAAEANLGDKDILNLILLPGFSTAQAITSVSGRGVGMDVVKKQIDALRGSLVLSSEAGKGTKISLTLPLTLAIIEGLLVEAGSHQLIIPMTAVMENVELQKADRLRGNGRNVIAVRGELVPYIDLRETFHLGGDAPAIEKIVIVHQEDQRVGLVVDRVLGTHQTVIQSLGKFFRNINVVSGATIMGDGRVALIMDIASVVGFADRLCQAAPAWADAEQLVA